MAASPPPKRENHIPSLWMIRTLVELSVFDYVNELCCCRLAAAEEVCGPV